MSTKLMNYLNIGDDQFEVADAAARAGIGSPLVAATAADMTDTSKVYVYTGSETGYTAGNWYYYNGSAWTSGGIYNSAAVNVDTTLTVAGAAADAKVVGDKFDVIEADFANKANVDGAYENMTVGNAEQLVSAVGEYNKTPYLFRTSGGSIDIGDREVDKLVGGTVAFNQMIQNGNFASSSNWQLIGFGSLSVSGNIGTLTSVADNMNSIYQMVTIPAGHKYLISADIKSDISVNSKFSEGSAELISCLITDNWQRFSTVANKGSSSNNIDFIRFSGVNDVITFNIKNVMCIDLTQMFGSTIADYIYSLEQSQAGDGVAWFRNLFGADYYAYNAGQLMSVKTSSHEMVGFNAYDNSTGKAKLVGGMEYQITGTYTSLSYSTGETITPDANGKFTLSANGELTVTGGNATDTCVHLVWDGERDDEYEEYKKTSYALDSDLELRGIPKLDASNNLYYDGDTYESNGSVMRKYGIVTYDGTEGGWNWFDNYNQAYIDLPSLAKYEVDKISYICDKLTSVPNQNRTQNLNNFASLISSGASVAFSAPNCNSLADFKTWLSNNNLTFVYELDTPTTESADPFTNPQAVDDFGTEEYVDSRTVPIPVGHDTMYQANLRAKLETVPNLPEANGLYLVKYENGDAVYQQYVSPVPTLPTEDGTYSLKCTVADGTASLSWIADT